nr:immunoglobulin light chain junction region [Macaca mulatta]MOV67757.1 immunoglobulin light chain junction region [Macaca mulatta]MOV67975.1 immunoglobulin light chain junction region [Macaca mulatta]MOV68489.1 immunoglobulin light chain junction region [Macaca mulatta]MOV69168.1 immunoglobulin light chain junction region [Macaca mulatta]
DYYCQSADSSGNHPLF